MLQVSHADLTMSHDDALQESTPPNLMLQVQFPSS